MLKRQRMLFGHVACRSRTAGGNQSASCCSGCVRAPTHTRVRAASALLLSSRSSRPQVKPCSCRKPVSRRDSALSIAPAAPSTQLLHCMQQAMLAKLRLVQAACQELTAVEQEASLVTVHSPVGQRHLQSVSFNMSLTCCGKCVRLTMPFMSCHVLCVCLARVER